MLLIPASAMGGFGIGTTSLAADDISRLRLRMVVTFAWVRGRCGRDFSVRCDSGHVTVALPFRLRLFGVRL